MVNFLKNKAMRILSVFVCFALVFGVFTAVLSLRSTAAYADDANEYTGYKTETINITNSQFDSSSGSAPKTPSGWTAGGIGGSGTGSAFGGVLELDNYRQNVDAYKIDTFAPFDAPDSPFGPDSAYKDTTRSVLLVNIPEGSAAYGYTSSTISFTANRFYHITAWVRTCDFTQKNAKGGAAIRLNGLGDDVAFTGIDTVANLYNKTDKKYVLTQANNYGWEKYEFYIASSSYASQTVTISLQVGDRYTDEKDNTKDSNSPAAGYALFDNVEAFQISPAAFLNAQKAQDEQPSKNTLVKDFSSQTTSQFTKIDGIENLDFTQDLDGWSRVTGKTTDATDLPIGVYNGYNAFDENNKYGLTSDPASSLGKYADDSYILVISSYTGKETKKTVAVGYSTKEFTLKRNRFYRLSVWVKTQDVSEGSGATFALSVRRSALDEEYAGKNLYSTITSCTGESENRARSGFREYAFYVKGSAYFDYPASLECLLGTEGNPSSGIAMFDNLTLEEITPAQYTENSSGGTVVNLDTDGSGISYPNTGVANGTFYDVSYDIASLNDFTYPLAPASWTMYTTDTAGSRGYATNSVKTEDAKSGVIPTDEATFKEYREEFGAGVRNPGSKYSSVLMMYSESDTAYCYRSSGITVATETIGKISVRLDAFNLKGYGASLVLKNSDMVIATIENITADEPGYKTYNFYVEPSSSEVTLNVEIWMGMLDRKTNQSKLSRGHLYVESVSYNSETTADEFKARKQIIDNEKHAGLAQTEAAYSFKTIDFSAFDYYDTSDLKYPYDWTLSILGSHSSDTVSYGIFDPARPPAVATGFTNTKGATDHGVLMLLQSAPSYSQISYNGSIALTADSYYKIDIAVKVDIPAQENAKAVGAKIMLLKDGAATKYAFTDIVDTTEKHDDTLLDEFRTYTFYVNAGSTDSTASLRLSLGDSSTSTWCSGRIYVNKITASELDESTYNDVVKQIKKGKLDYAMKAEMSNAAPVEDDDVTPSVDTGSDLNWWVIPSILFAVAILIAIVGFMIRKLMEKKSKKKGTVERTVSYDRRNTLNATHNENADEEDKVSDVEPVDESYNAFDDDTTTEPVQKKKVQPSEPVEEESESPAEEAPVEESDTASTDEGETVEESPATEDKADAFLDAFDD